MSHGSQTIEAPGTACPAGCVADHGENTTLHLFPEVTFRDIYRKPIHVSPFVNDGTGRAGVYVGEHELFVEDAEGLSKAIMSAAYNGAIALLSRS